MDESVFESVIVLPKTEALIPLFTNLPAIPLAVFSRLNCWFAGSRYVYGFSLTVMDHV